MCKVSMNVKIGNRGVVNNKKESVGKSFPGKIMWPRFGGVSSMLY